MKERQNRESDRFTQKDLKYVIARTQEARQNPAPRVVVEDLYGEIIFNARPKVGK